MLTRAYVADILSCIPVTQKWVAVSVVLGERCEAWKYEKTRGHSRWVPLDDGTDIFGAQKRRAEAEVLAVLTAVGVRSWWVRWDIDPRNSSGRYSWHVTTKVFDEPADKNK